MPASLEGQETRNVEILLARMFWNNGLTLSQAWKRMQIKRPGASLQTLIAEWRRLKRLFGCKSLPLPYLYGYIPKPPTAQELAAVVGKLSGGHTYGDWLGVTGPGKRLREMLAKDTADGSEDGHEIGSAQSRSDRV